MTSFYIFLALLVIGVLAYGLWNFVELDRCLDAGGRWNYEIDRCEGAREEG